MPKAIIVTNADVGEGGDCDFLTHADCLAQTEILGRSVLARMRETLKRSGCESVSTIAVQRPKEDASALLDTWELVAAEISRLRAAETDALVIYRVGAYVEFDAMELVRFHFAGRKAVTRACDEGSAFDLWVVDPAQLPSPDEVTDFIKEYDPALCLIRGYVNRLEDVRDMRRLVVDGMTSQCRFRPLGFEVKPGIWIAPGAQVEKSARMVAPLYVGRGVKVAEDCLITRCTNIESNCEIDYGTAVEDSSILANTYVGIGLDVSHSVAQGNELFNLQHEVRLRISDSAVMRRGKIKAGKERQVPNDFQHSETEMAFSKESGVQ